MTSSILSTIWARAAALFSAASSSAKSRLYNQRSGIPGCDISGKRIGELAFKVSGKHARHCCDRASGYSLGRCSRRVGDAREITERTRHSDSDMKQEIRGLFDVGRSRLQAGVVRDHAGLQTRQS